MSSRLRMSLPLHLLALGLAWLGRALLHFGKEAAEHVLPLLAIDFAANLLAWRIVHLVRTKLGREIETNEIASFVYVLPLLSAYFTLVDMR